MGESEQANQHGDKGETAQQVGGAEGHAHLAAHGVDADSGDDKSDHAAHQALEDGAGGDGGDNGDAKDGQGEVLRLGELQRHRGQQGGEDHQADGGEDPSEGGGEGGQARARLAGP